MRKDSRIGSSDFILDCSVTMGWCFEDEVTSYTEAVLSSLIDVKAYVPSLWYLEVSNVLLMAEKKKRINRLKVSAFIDTLRQLPIIQEDNTKSAFGALFDIARETDLTIYDASYLELALRLNKPLATLDKALKHAAKHCGVLIVG